MPLKKLIKSTKNGVKHLSYTTDLGIDEYFKIFLIYLLLLNFSGLSLVVSAIFSLTPAFSSVTPALTLDRYAFYGPVQYELAIMVRMAMNLALTLFRLGGGFSNPPSGKIVITPTPKEL